MCDAFEYAPATGYDPLDDVAESPEGVWAWATDKPGLRQSIKVRVTLGLLRSSKNNIRLTSCPSSSFTGFYVICKVFGKSESHFQFLPVRKKKKVFFADDSVRMTRNVA